MESLRDFHVVKKNLVACSSRLAEAANWDNLMNAVDQSLRVRDLANLSKTLGLMRKSLLLLEHMPNSENRASLLARVEQRVESLIVPSMSALLKNEGNVGAKELAVHVDLFRQVGREQQLSDIYIESKQQLLHAYWNS